MLGRRGWQMRAGVFLDGVNNCQVTVWASQTQTENKKDSKMLNEWNTLQHPELNSVLVTEITSTWRTQPSQN